MNTHTDITNKQRASWAAGALMVFMQETRGTRPAASADRHRLWGGPPFRGGTEKRH